MSPERGGADSDRRDAFRLSARLAAWAIPALVAPGGAALVFGLYDIGGILDRPSGRWLMPGGFVLLMSAVALGAIVRRKPVLLMVGPGGLELPARLARPVPWESIRRIRCTGGSAWTLASARMLKIDLADGARLRYKRRFWIWPEMDARIALRHGLNAPLQHLDADEDAVVASIERFHAVDRGGSGASEE